MTSGACRPCSTTLLAFCWHKGSLWAIPDLPLMTSAASRSKSSSQANKAQQMYQLLRLDLNTNTWQAVPTQVMLCNTRT
jgi:hypothetical protein